MGFFDVINKGFDVVNDGMARAQGNIINGFISPFVQIGNKISRNVEHAKRGERLELATGGTIAGPVLRRPTHHGMSGRTSFEAHSKGMSHQFKPVGQSFAQASFAQGGYFPGADHRLI